MSVDKTIFAIVFFLSLILSVYISAHHEYSNSISFYLTNCENEVPQKRSFKKCTKTTEI